MESILLSTKKFVAVSESEDHFDEDLMMLINTVFSTLHQIGIGPEEGFFIFDETKTWDDFSTNPLIIHTVKTYVHLKVKMIFDPPTTSSVAEAYKETINELEFRLKTESETVYNSKE